jgi:predicted transcriptional regulator
MKNTDIAKILGITPETVSYTLNSELVKRQLVIMRGARDKDTIDVAERIRNLVPIALDRYEELLANPDTHDRILVDISKDLLDRAGYAAQRSVKIDVTNHLTTEDLMRIKEVARENGYIDADYTEVPALAEEAML